MKRTVLSPWSAAISGQLAFGFLDPPEPRNPTLAQRLFTCTDAGGAGPAVVGCRDRILRENGIVWSRIPPERLHISLCWVGDFARIPSAVPFAAVRAAEKIVMPAFDVVLDRAVTFIGRRPEKRATVLLAQGDGLRQLGSALFDRLRHGGLKPAPMGAPHMTLFYSPASVRPAEIEPIRFRVGRFFLIHSERGLTKYNVLGCWSLEGAPPEVAEPFRHHGNVRPD